MCILTMLRIHQRAADAPHWITEAYLEACAQNAELQDALEPKVGDWYFCADQGKVSQITDLESYYYEGDRRAPSSEHGKDAAGQWTCDIYLPPPEVAA